MNILAIGAHPDDIECRMGGILWLYAKRGDEITLCVATNGNSGSGIHDNKKEVGEIRYREMQASADMLGAELIWMDKDDEFLFDTEETRLLMIDAVRQARPDVIFAPPYMSDYNPDHDMTGYLAYIARINASIHLIKTNHPPTDKIPPLFMCTPSGLSYTTYIPDHFVDITSVWEKKVALAQCHESQYKHHSVSSMVYKLTKKFEAENRYYASQCGTPEVEFVEAFMNQRTYPMVVEAYKYLP